MSKSAYQRAGYLALLSIALGVLVPFIPANGAGHATAPLFVIVGAVSGWFWYKGRFGSAADSKWVEDNF
jgi:hypothetical protein